MSALRLGQTKGACVVSDMKGTLKLSLARNKARSAAARSPGRPAAWRPRGSSTVDHRPLRAKSDHSANSLQSTPSRTGTLGLPHRAFQCLQKP